ncbi:hypothetical protein Tco_1160460 [Tanacetum coccineum]
MERAAARSGKTIKNDDCLWTFPQKDPLVLANRSQLQVYCVLKEQQISILTKEEQRKRDQDEMLYTSYILNQVPEFEILVSKFKNLNIEMPKKLLVGAIITKLPFSCHNYKKKLMHTSEDFTLDQIQKHLRIEEETCIHEKNLNGASSSKELHMASVTTTTDDWWYDSGETTHVCNNKDLFKTYKETEDGHEVMTGDNHTSKNLVYGFKLCKSDVKVVIELDKVILCKANLFVGKATNEIVTQTPQDISGPNLNSNNKRKTAESFSAPRKSERDRKERKFDPDFIDSQAIIFLVECDNEKNVIIKIPVLLNVEDAPITYTETITSRNSASWKEAIDDEMDYLISNNTWELSDLPPCTKTMGVNGYLG